MPCEALTQVPAVPVSWENAGRQLPCAAPELGSGLLAEVNALTLRS